MAVGFPYVLPREQDGSCTSFFDLASEVILRDTSIVLYHLLNEKLTQNQMEGTSVLSMECCPSIGNQV